VPTKEEFVVTPYEVKGKIDYQRLKELFGTQDLTPDLLDQIRARAGGELHPLLARGIYFSHRDLGETLQKAAHGHPFFLYSGRGPSGPLHTSHLLPFDLCQWLQKKFDAPMYIQITDDEKFWVRGGLTRQDTYRWGLDNLADILALGFDPKRTRVFFDTRSIGAMYPLAVDVAKKINFSTVKSVFGFSASQNVGAIFYTALQTVPCFWPSWYAGRPIPCLIPCGIDQDPHFRVSRDMAESLGYPKPALLHSIMLPGLLGERVMSTTGDSKDNAIFLDDTPKEVERKVKHALTGGRATVEEQRRLGAVPEICSVWAMWRSKFAKDDSEFEQITRDCRSGALLCGDCKANLVPRVQGFLADHAKRKKAVRGTVESLILEGAERSDASGPVVRGDVPLP
jgi:tryptophanyl-tRNA synthetase